MKVQSLKGTIFHIDASPISQLLIDAGIAILVSDAPPKPQPVKWSVHRSEEQYGSKLGILAMYGGERMIFRGPNAASQVFHNETVPPEIAAEYERLRKK